MGAHIPHTKQGGQHALVPEKPRICPPGKGLAAQLLVSSNRGSTLGGEGDVGAVGKVEGATIGFGVDCRFQHVEQPNMGWGGVVGGGVHVYRGKHVYRGMQVLQ